MSAPDVAREVELTLYVSGASHHAARAIADARALCDAHLAGRHVLLVVDVNEDPAAFLRSGVLAAPALVRTRPAPARKLVGDLSDAPKVISALGLGNPSPPTPERR